MTSISNYNVTIYVVCHGVRYGLLIEKEMLPSRVLNYAYFHLQDPNVGLIPTLEVREICGQDCYDVKATKLNLPIFEIVKKYAHQFKSGATKGDVVPFISVYNGPENTYVRQLSNFFTESTSYLRNFLEDYDHFKANILCKPKREHRIECNAKLIAVCKPEHLPFNPKYFIPIRKLLKIGDNVKAEWFRASGPIAMDIDKGMICREDCINEIHAKWKSNFLFMIFGKPGIGKSVICRLLAYDIFTAGEARIYYFSFAKDGDIDIHQFADVINGLRGYFILDDTHLKMRKVNRLCFELLNEDKNKHILLIKREISQDDGDYQTNKLPSLEIVPSEETSLEIIEKFSSSQEHRGIPFPEKIKRVVLDEFGNNRWHLAYALQGWDNLKGKGDPFEWPQAGVQKELFELQRCENSGRSVNYPKVLVALAPLYRNEVLTAEKYLVDNLKITEPELAALTLRGNIIKRLYSEKVGENDVK